jgi:transposase
VFNVPGKRGRKHAEDLRSVVDAMLYIAPTGCQWRCQPGSFGPCTRFGRSPPLVTQRHLDATASVGTAAASLGTP